MKVKSSQLENVSVMKKQYPDNSKKEIAFVGRSNVGKSSFINAMINRKALARTSSSPGKTRTINFYLINEEFRFVDLPGYGYAKASKSEISKWANIINEYLHERDNLEELFLLVDIRHQPTQQDIMMYDWVKSYGYKGYVIVTKSDKIKKGQYGKNISVIKKTLGITEENLIIPFSSVKKDNIEHTWSVIDKILKGEE